MSMLPGKLQSAVHLSKLKPMLTSVPVFADANDAFVKRIAAVVKGEAFVTGYVYMSLCRRVCRVQVVGGVVCTSASMPAFSACLINNKIEDPTHALIRSRHYAPDASLDVSREH